MQSNKPQQPCMVQYLAVSEADRKYLEVPLRAIRELRSIAHAIGELLSSILLLAKEGVRRQHLILPSIGELESVSTGAHGIQCRVPFEFAEAESQRAESTKGKAPIAKEVGACCACTKQAGPLDSSEIIVLLSRFGFFDFRIVGFDLFPDQFCNIFHVHFHINSRQTVCYHR